MNCKIVSLIIFFVFLIIPTKSFAVVLWEQNFDNSSIWQSVSTETQDVSTITTHSEAIFMWNVSSYRVAKQKYDNGGTTILEVSNVADRHEN